jgi:hypothetical protein
MIAAVRVSSPPEGVGAVAGQLHLADDLLEGGIAPVGSFGDDLRKDRRHAVVLALGGREDRGAPRGAWPATKALPVDPFLVQVAGRRPGVQHVIGHVALVERGGHHALGQDEAAAITAPSQS